MNYTEILNSFRQKALAAGYSNDEIKEAIEAAPEVLGLKAVKYFFDLFLESGRVDH